MPASGLHRGWRQIVDVCLLSLTSVQISCVPRRTSLEATLERSLKGRLDSVLLGWTRHGRLEQVRPYKVWHDPGNMKGFIQTKIVPLFSLFEIFLQIKHEHLFLLVTKRFVHLKVKALSSWSRSEEMNETKLELKQPFSSTLSQMSLHTLSHSSQREQRSSQQVGCHNFTWSS